MKNFNLLPSITEIPLLEGFFFVFPHFFHTLTVWIKIRRLTYWRWGTMYSWRVRRDQGRPFSWTDLLPTAMSMPSRSRSQLRPELPRRISGGWRFTLGAGWGYERASQMKISNTSWQKSIWWSDLWRPQSWSSMRFLCSEENFSLLSIDFSGLHVFRKIHSEGCRWYSSETSSSFHPWVDEGRVNSPSNIPHGKSSVLRPVFSKGSFVREMIRSSMSWVKSGMVRYLSIHWSSSLRGRSR